MEIKHIFTLKNEHLMLLRNMYIMWNDDMSGAPMIDPKRPYGNSDVYKDIAKILNIGEDQEILMDKLHKETETALQIVLRTGKFEPGIYESDNYKLNWRKIKDFDTNDVSEKRKTKDGITLIS